MSSTGGLGVLGVGVGVVQRQVTVVVEIRRLTLCGILVAGTEFILERLLLGVGSTKLTGRAVGS